MSDVEIAVDETQDMAAATATVADQNTNIKQWIDILFVGGEVVELRIPKAKAKNGRSIGTISGYYDDHAELAADIASSSGKQTAVYYTLNPVDSSLLSRSCNKARENASETTTDAQIIRRRWLLLDIDPQRPAGISSSDEEKAAARSKMVEIGSYLKTEGWPSPITGDSGNGYHLLYRVDLENTADITALIKSVLGALAAKFDTDAVKVDKSVFNAARIVKAYGSMARKGEELPSQNRFHRESKLLSTSGGKECVTVEQLSALAGVAAVSPIVKPKSKDGFIVSSGCTVEQVKTWLDKHGVEVKEESDQPDGRHKIVLTECPFNPEHTGKDAAVFVGRDGLGFKCFHNSCSGNGWKELRAELETRTGTRYSIKTGEELTGDQVQEQTIDPDDWRSLFHTYAETIAAPPLKFAIEKFLQEDGITFIGGLAGHGKTYVMLNIVRTLFEGGKLWDYFTVNEPSKRVLYLIPESGLGPFVHRLEKMKLLKYVESGQLLYRTMSACESNIPLTDPRILKAAEGADVFLDTAIRFMSGDENSSSDNRRFAETLFTLQKAGARTLVGAHHSPKAFEHIDAVSLENALRGSGDVGAMLATAWAVKQIDLKTTRLYVKSIKARDFEPCQSFELEGRPWIDKLGTFKMVAAPGMAICPQQGKTKRDKASIGKAMRLAGKTHKEIAEALDVTVRTVENWEAEGRLRNEDTA